MMDDDQDGGIEVEESVEVQELLLYKMLLQFSEMLSPCEYSCLQETDRVEQYNNRCPGWW